MAVINDDAQWIVLIGFVVSISIFFLALIVNSSALVGQTTSEAVLEFPKHDIQDLRGEIVRLNAAGELFNTAPGQNITSDLRNLSMERSTSIVTITESGGNVLIHYNNGITEYNEVYNETLNF